MEKLKKNLRKKTVPKGKKTLTIKRANKQKTNGVSFHKIRWEDTISTKTKSYSDKKLVDYISKFKAPKIIVFDFGDNPQAVDIILASNKIKNAIKSHGNVTVLKNVGGGMSQVNIG